MIAVPICVRQMIDSVSEVSTYSSNLRCFHGCVVANQSCKWFRNRNQIPESESESKPGLLESELESESNDAGIGIRIRIGISSSGIGIGIGIMKNCNSGIRLVWESHVICWVELFIEVTDFAPWLLLEKNYSKHHLCVCIMTNAFVLKQIILVHSFCPPPPALRLYRYINTDIVLFMLVPFGSKARHCRHQMCSPVYLVSNNEINFYYPVISI